MKLREKPTKMLNCDFILVLVVTFLYGLNMNLINPITAQYASSFGADETMMGIAVGVFSITALLVRPVTGPLANSGNNNKMLMLAFFVYASSSFGYILFSNIYNLLLMRFIHGFGVSLCSALLPTMACEYVPENKIGSAIGYFSLAQTIAMAVGPSITLKVSERFGFSGSFILAGIVATIAFFTVFALSKQQISKKKIKFSISDMVAKEAVFPTILHTIGAAVYSLISSFLVIYAVSVRGINNETIGWYFTTYAIALIATRPLLSFLEMKVKDIYVIAVGSIISLISMVILSVAESMLLFIISSVLMAFGFGIVMPVLQTLSVKLVSRENRATANSTFNAGMDIGMGLGPVIGGVVASKLGYANMFFVFSFIEIPAVILAVIFRKKLLYKKYEAL